MRKLGKGVVRGGAVVIPLLVLGGWASRYDRLDSWGASAVRPNQEDLRPDGAPYNPATQSFLRGHHWLETVERVEVLADSRNMGLLRLRSREKGQEFRVCKLPLEHLVPRLHYRAASPPDAFDAFNLMLAEYSRNGMTVPTGQPGDQLAHFETSLSAERPWQLGERDYSFIPNPYLRPFRFAVINNCLTPGLWELSAVDRAGEIYHAWFDFPIDAYVRLVAAVNGVDGGFARRALEWRAEPVPLDLGRLREQRSLVGATPVALVPDQALGFSSQDSRRKLAQNFVQVADGENLRRPASLAALTSGNTFFSEFVPPGKYSLEKRRRFDLRFLARPVGARVARVHPLSSYQASGSNRAGAAYESGDGYLEIDIELADKRMVIGNLPIKLLVPQEDFVLHGFGVGVLSADALAEQRVRLIERGPAPSFAYVVEDRGGVPMALNSHDYGIEQIFIRTHSQEAEPWWEITVASYERIVDLVKYRVDIPEPLRQELRQNALSYISPVYFTYRDDNLR